jgi:ABC-2 type transport system permease protein
MTTTAPTINKAISAPKKRAEGLIIVWTSINNAKTPIGAGCFYGALIAILAGVLTPTMSSINLSGYISSAAISSMIGGHVGAAARFDFTTFLAVELFSSIYGLLFGGIMAYAAGAALPLNIENGTLDLALSRPISRSRYYLETWLGIFLGGILMGLVIVLFVWIAGLFLKNPNLNWQWLWITQLIQYTFFVFAIGVGMLFGSFINASRSAGGIAVGIIALGYLLNVFGGLSSSVDWLLKISPYYYAPSTDVLLTHQLTWWHPLVLVAAGLLCGIAGLITFNRRDLPTV